MEANPREASNHAILGSLGVHRDDLRAAIAAVPAHRHAERPAQGRWSVDLIVEHLALVENSVARLLRARLRNLPTDAAGAHQQTPRLDAQRVLDRTQRIAAIAVVDPKGGVAAVASLAALQRSRAELLEVAHAARGLDTSSIRVPHQMLGPLGFWQWIEFVGLHEGRHVAQIREVAAALP
jgi:hypothetical protein